MEGATLVESNTSLNIYQTGMSWFPEQPGNGLDRVYYALYENFAHANVIAHGSVAGTNQVAVDSSGEIQAFASDTAPLTTRMMKQRALVKSALKENSYDLIASHFALYTYPILGIVKKYPMVVHFHGPWADESVVEGSSETAYKLKKYIERRVYAKADMFIVLSNAFRQLLVTDFGIPESKIRIVPGGADLDRFDCGLSQEEARSQLGWEEDHTIIVSVRRLARRMGIENLIDAVRHLVKTNPNIRLKIAGKGPLEEEFQLRIVQLGLQRNIELLGYVSEDDLPAIYAAADLSVVPTIKLEGFGLITVESLASGTPCLVTPVGGLPEVVGPLSGSLVTDDTTLQSLQNSLEGILAGQIDIPDAQTCRKYARDNYDWKAVALKTREVYDEVLAL